MSVPTKNAAARRTMRLKPYPTYKHSGMEWLGEIPAHWDLKMVKRLASMRAGIAITGEEIEPVGEYAVFGGNGIRGYTSSYTHDGAFPLIGRQGALCGCVNFASGKFWASEHAVVVAPTASVDPWWLAKLLEAMSLNAYSQSAAQPGLAVETVSSIRVPFPAIDEQRAIAAFLERETASIDALLAKKKRLIELLREKRAAIITRAITKGLDPTVPMKNSGVSWLGEIPADWEVLGAGRLIEHIEQGWSPVAEDRAASVDEWGVIKLSAVSKGAFREEEHKALPVGLSPETRYEIREGDFLLTRANTPDFVGDVCVVRGTRSRLMLCDLVYRLALRRDYIVPEFLAYWFLSPSGRYQIEVEARGASQSMVKVSQGLIRRWMVVLPRLPEQRAITGHLDLETARIDALIAKIRSGINDLKELRIALISAAVTGKIDVREEVA